MCFSSITLPFLTQKWLNPHFESDFNTFQDKLRFGKTNLIENLVNVPIYGCLAYSQVYH